MVTDKLSISVSSQLDVITILTGLTVQSENIWSMAVPPQLCEVTVKVEATDISKPRCLLDMTIQEDPKNDHRENISLELSPEALATAIDSLVKVRAQLDSIARKTKA